MTWRKLAEIRAAPNAKKQSAFLTDVLRAGAREVTILIRLN